jgi:hypothetical protein
MSFMFGTPSKARNLTSYIYIYIYIYDMEEIFYWGFAFEPCISLIYVWKTNKYTIYSFSLLVMYGISYMLRRYSYVAIYYLSSDIMWAGIAQSV